MSQAEPLLLHRNGNSHHSQSLFVSLHPLYDANIPILCEQRSLIYHNKNPDILFLYDSICHPPFPSKNSPNARPELRVFHNNGEGLVIMEGSSAQAICSRRLGRGQIVRALAQLAHSRRRRRRERQA